MVKRLVLIVVMLGCMSSVNAGNQVVELNLNENDLELSLARVQSWSKHAQTFFGMGFLSSIQTINGEKKKVTMADATMTHVGNTEVKGLGIGLGFKAIYSDLNMFIPKQTAEALAVRFKLLYTLPIVVKSIVSATINYAPGSLSFSSGLERYSDNRFEINFQPIPAGWFYIGYRKVSFGIENSGELVLNESGYLGYKIYF